MDKYLPLQFPDPARHPSIFCTSLLFWINLESSSLFLLTSFSSFISPSSSSFDSSNICFFFISSLELSLSPESDAVIFVPVDFAIVDFDELGVEVMLVEEDTMEEILEKGVKDDVETAFMWEAGISIHKVPFYILEIQYIDCWWEFLERQRWILSIQWVLDKCATITLLVYRYSSSVPPKWSGVIQEISTLSQHAWCIFVSEEPSTIAPHYLNQWTVGIDAAHCQGSVL